MDEKAAWELFVKTGSPVFYMKYRDVTSGRSPVKEEDHLEVFGQRSDNPAEQDRRK